MDAFYTFLADDGWAIASHIALSTLMALFPFLIVLTSLAGFFGSKELADGAVGLLLQVWPQQVADALSGEIHDVLTTTRGGVLTVGVVLAVYFARYGITITAMTVALFVLHAWLPCGRRSFMQILPGIVFTMVASLISGIVFGQYLARFASNYVTMYAGLASVIIALVFLYFISAIFVYGGELNAAIMKSHLPKGMSLHAAQSRARAETQA